MAGSWPTHELPHLTTATCEIKSKATNRYNCIAWAAGEDFRNWWPDPNGVGYWPSNVPREVTIQAFILAYGTLGFQEGGDGRLETGIQKLALYVKGQPEIPTHAALQLESGQWTSKLGPFEDVNHTTPEAATGPVYGRVYCYLSRPRRRPSRT
jgi:hypothetical protein